MSNGTNIKVLKRDGTETSLNLDKIHKIVEEACEGLGGGVSASQVEMNSGLQFFDGISTKDIQEILVRSASDLISLDFPNYQFVAARLLLYGVYKQVFGSEWVRGLPSVYDHALHCTNKSVYEQCTAEWKTDERDEAQHSDCPAKIVISAALGFIAEF